MKRKITILLFVFALVTQWAIAQEIHLSQYFTAKMLNNPAQTGNINSDFKASLHHRSQWNSVSTPFVLSVFSLETKFKVNRAGTLGAGFYLSKNKAGKSLLNQQVYAGNVSYRLKLSKGSEIAAGLLVGYRQRSINLAGLAWDAQHNGVAYDPTLPTGETMAGDKNSSLDFGLGLLWKHRGNTRYDVGYSASHYFQGQGFLATTTDALLLKQMASYTHYFTYQQFDIDAIGCVIIQGGSIEGVMGVLANYRYGRDSRHTNNLTSSYLSFGALYRYQDALVPMVGYNYRRKFSGYLSYDFNVSKLRTISSYRGAWEVNLQFTGLFKDNRRKMSELN